LRAESSESQGAGHLQISDSPQISNYPAQCAFWGELIMWGKDAERGLFEGGFVEQGCCNEKC
jgi:hypothetical protein